jgi:hypothetical protein
MEFICKIHMASSKGIYSRPVLQVDGQGNLSTSGCGADCRNIMTCSRPDVDSQFRSKFWSAKIYCSISFIFGNNCPTID